MDATIWGPVLRNYRKRRGLLMHQVGSSLNVSESCICRYESGKRQIPPDLLVAWALLLGAREILTGACSTCPVGVALQNNNPLNAA